MSAMITGIAHTKSIPIQKSRPHALRVSNACRRCNGLLVDEHCMDIDTGIPGREYWAKRCIQCGDVVDEIILRNSLRLSSHAPKHWPRRR